MKVRRLERAGALAVIFETGEEFIAGLRQCAAEQGIQAARLTGIGAFQTATVSYFEWSSRSYLEIPVGEQVEVLVLAGDLALKDGKPEPHVHVVLGRRDGSTVGGHLVRGTVRPTLELMLESGGALVRKFDPASGLPLIA